MAPRRKASTTPKPKRKGGKKKPMDGAIRRLVVQSIPHPGGQTTHQEAWIEEQSHRGAAFTPTGEDYWTDPDTGVTLRCNSVPDWQSGNKRLYVQGTDASSDLRRFALTNDEWALVQQAVAHYNKTFGKQGPPLLIESVVLDAPNKERIRAALAQYHHGDKLWNEWGLGDVMEKGRAISLLFFGPPGTGKTLMAEAIASETKQTLKILGTAELESSVPGQMERNVMEAFDKARKQKQVLLFDECDSLIYDRSDVGMILGAQINTLLSQLERHTGIVIFTTNRLGVLDAAMERRLACKVEFPFPDAAARVLIWKRLLPEKLPLDARINIEKLAQVPLSGGHIKNCVLAAARLALYRELKEVSAECFAEAITQERHSIITWMRAQGDPRAPGLRGRGGYQRGTDALSIAGLERPQTLELTGPTEEERDEPPQG